MLLRPLPRRSGAPSVAAPLQRSVGRQFYIEPIAACSAGMPPRRTSLERSLPATKNELMLGEVDLAVLGSKCRVQDVRFGPADEEGITETFVRIKTQIPNSSMPHFIMRKAQDDYVSATSMYRAVYYKSTSVQEKLEMEVVKRDFAARSDDNASGVWIPGTPDALNLADIYGIKPWVQALLSAPTTKAAYPDEHGTPSARGSSPVLTSGPSVAATPSRRSARERSQSPRKTVNASTRKVKKVAKDAVDTIKEDAHELAEAVQNHVLPAIVKDTDLSVSDKLTSPISSTVESASAKAEDLVQSLKPTEIEAKFSALVDGAGQSVADMLAEARAQVEEAQAKDADALASSGLSSTSDVKQKGKKRSLELEDEEVIQNQIISVKRGKVEELEVGLVQEKRKVRALFGLVLGLGATAILPYIL